MLVQIFCPIFVRTSKQTQLKNYIIMTKEQEFQAAVQMIGFDYFMNCIKNGATPEQAKAEMLTEKAQKEIAEMIKKITA